MMEARRGNRHVPDAWMPTTDATLIAEAQDDVDDIVDTLLIGTWLHVQLRRLYRPADATP